MASPARHNGSPASRHSTPSKSTPNGPRRVNGYNSPFRDSTTASPSRQLLQDYGRVYASEQRSLKRSLEDQTSEQQAKHLKALDEALTKHGRVRESAQRELEYIKIENEREARRREEIEAQRIEDAMRRLEQQKEDEQRRRAAGERARQEESRRREALKHEEEDARRHAATRQLRDDEEKVKKQQQWEKEESDRRAKEGAEARRKEQQAQKDGDQATRNPTASAAQPDGVGSSSGSAAAPSTQPAVQSANVPRGLVSTQSEIEASHQRYLTLHQRLKKMRSEVADRVKAMGKEHKAQLTEWRQAIQRAIGMLGKLEDPETKKRNQDRLRAIQVYLDAAAQTTQPMIDVTQFLVDNRQPAGAPKEGPAQLLFLLNHFAKSVMKQIIAEASDEPQIANAIGILAVTVFARPNYLFNGQSLIDILWAKYHKRCPVLFGISGNERSAQGRLRIGWDRNGEDLPPDLYYAGIRGLAVGFSNITLRSFAKSANQNPAPNRMFWESMARVLNTPTNQVQPTHFELLKAIIENTSPRIMSVYGGAAMALIRRAVIDFPAPHQKDNPSAVARSKAIALASLPRILQQKYRLSL